MAKIIPIREHFQHFVEELQASFWGDLYGRTRQAWKKFFELESERLRDGYAGWPHCGRGARRAGGYRKGYYVRGFATAFGRIRLRIARARGKSFLPPGIGRFQRRAAELAMLIREAFLRGLATRQVAGGGDVDRRSGERADGVAADSRLGGGGIGVSARASGRGRAYLLFDGVSLRVRRPAGRKRVQMLVAYGIRPDGRRPLRAFLRSWLSRDSPETHPPRSVTNRLNFCNLTTAIYNLPSCPSNSKTSLRSSPT